MASVIAIGSKTLSLEEIWAVAFQGKKVELLPQALRRIQQSHRFLQKEIKKGQPLYGVNTGFGLLSNVKIPDSDIETLQYNLLRSHAVGTGAPLPDPYVRAMLVLRAQALSLGHSGAREEVIQQILLLINRCVCPIVPEQGSVGASGDLAPLAHLALVLIGEGRARYKGKEMSGASALEAANIPPIRLGPKEGLALINGTQFMTALGTLSLLEAEYLCDVADAAGALSIEAMRGTATAFSPEIQNVRPHPGQVHVAQRMRDFLNSKGTEIARSHAGCGKVQDPYSLRCIPQVHGASRDALKWVREVLEREVNSVTDNPLVFPRSQLILSGGNFHGQVVAIAMDLLAIAMAEIASISEQRLEKLVNPTISELPAFLTQQGGLNSGFMIIQVAAASIVSENKTLCHPASVDSIPTSADKEDHVSMGAWAARKAALVIRNSRRVLAMELLAGAQGIDLLRPLRTTPVLERIHAQIRKESPTITQDRFFHDDIQAIEKLLETRSLQPWTQRPQKKNKKEARK